MALPDDDACAGWARRLRDGDRSALAELFRAAHPGLVALARRYAASDAEAEDAVQDTFVRLWETRARLDPARSLRALLATSVRHRLFNAMRDDARRRDLLAGAPRPDADPDTPEALTDAALLAERLRAWIGELPARRREAFELSRFDGLSHAEIAHTMGLSAKTVEHHVGAALRHLRDRLAASRPDLLASGRQP